MDALSVSNHALAEGSLVDHFKVLRMVGRGGMGEVYLARDTRLGRKVALKLIRGDAFTDRDAVERFLFEARVTARFAHPHIVTVFDVGEHLGQPYVALEYLEGQSLRARLETEKPSVRETLRIGLAIAEALAEAHRGRILHRDLKPENVFLPTDGRLRVLDFGIAKPDQTDAGPTSQGQRVSAFSMSMADTCEVVRGPEGQEFAGTPAYMAPEQWCGGTLTSAVDVWAFGIMLHEMVCGHHPYRDLSPVAMLAGLASDAPVPAADADVPADLKDLIARCLDKSPAGRPTSETLVQVLGAMVEGPAPSLEGERSPFRGLLPFTEAHRSQFFGRESEVLAFLERLRFTPVLPVVGPSGAGKSSFVQAGVIPRLREQGRWVVLTFRPGARPFDALAARIVRGEGGFWDQSSGGGSSSSAGVQHVDTAAEVAVAAELREAPGRLNLMLQRIAEQEKCRVLLYVDQLEEVFTHVSEREVHRSFLDAVCTAADDAGLPVRVVFSVRDDFLVNLSATQSGRHALAQLTLLRSPGSEALREILTRPLAATGYAFEDDAIVDEMVRAVGDEAASLPLVQFACSQLWERRDRASRVLSRAAYDAIGGVEGALARHADAVLEGLTNEQTAIARELLLRLVTPEQTRRRVSVLRALEGLGDAGQSVMDHLVGARTLVVRKGAGSGEAGATVEIVHESLIRGWNTLRRWFEEAHHDVIFLAEVEQAAELWARRGRPGEEVWQGAALQEALAKARRIRAVPEDVQAFLRAGQDRERRRVLRRRWMLGGVIAGLGVVAAVLAVTAVEADQRRDEAMAQREAADRGRAEALRDSARRAYHDGSPLDARAMLRSSLTISDSTQARALWMQLRSEPLVWQANLMQVTDMTWSPTQPVLRVVIGGPVIDLDRDTAEHGITRQGERLQLFADHVPDGTKLVAGGSELAVWDLTGNDDARSMRAGTKMIRRVRVSPDGRLAAATGSPEGIHLVRLDSGESAGVLPEGGTSTGIEFSRDGRYLFSAGRDGIARRWHVENRKLESQSPPLDGGILDLALDETGTTVACGTTRGRLEVLRAADLGPERSIDAHRGEVSRVVFVSGKQVASGGVDGGVTAWDARSGQRERAFAKDMAAVTGISVDRQSGLLAAGSVSGQVRVWDLAIRPDPPAAGHTGIWFTAAFSPDSLVLATGERDENTVVLWDVATGRVRATLPGHAGGVRAVAFDPVRPVLATGGNDGSVRLWSLVDLAPSHAILGHGTRATALAYSPDGRYLATGDSTGKMRLYRAEDASQLMERQGAGTELRALAFAKGGEQIAATSAEGTLVVWDAAGGWRQRVVQRGPEGSVVDIAYSPDGLQLAHASGRGSLALWDRKTSVGREFQRPDAQVFVNFRSLSYHPSGDRICGAIGDGAPRAVWDLATGERKGEIFNALGPGWVCRFSPDGKYLASDDVSAVRLWDAQSLRPHWRGSVMLSTPPRLLTHMGWVDLDTGEIAGQKSGAAWQDAAERDAIRGRVSPDGKLLCLAMADGSVEGWLLEDDTRVFKHPCGARTEIFAVDGACVAGRQVRLDGQEVTLHAVTGTAVDIGKDCRSLSVLGNSIVTSTATEVIEYDVTGVERARRHTEGVVACASRMGQGWLIGSGDGTLEVVAEHGETATLQMADVLGLEWVRPGPANTVIGAFMQGQVGIWHVPTRELLYQIKLNGRPIHVLEQGGKLYVASDLGDSRMIDLRALVTDRCELLREVWQRVPVAWEAGRPRVTAPPSDHVCR
jgi:WD40 repeat protein/serine/threonine protein kinase